MTSWLSSHYETEDSIWYSMWIYFDEFRKMDNDVIESGIKYIENWCLDDTVLTPVGAVISRLLQSSVVKSAETRSKILSAIESGFTSTRFFFRRTNTSPQRRVHFFEVLIDDLKAKNDASPFHPYHEFVFDFFLGFVDVMTSEDFVREDLGIWTDDDELFRYASEIANALQLSPYSLVNMAREVSIFYFWSKRLNNKTLTSRIASLVRECGRNPADVTRAYGSGIGEDFWL